MIQKLTQTTPQPFRGLKSLAVVGFLLAAVTGNAQTTFNYTGAMQTYTVPPGVTSIRIDAQGAQGGSVTVACAATGGLGARMQGDVTVTPGEVLSVLVGGQGQTNGEDGGGGGGSFVVRTGNVPLVVAGGGGGASNNIQICTGNRNGVNASITTSGTASANGLVAGGSPGNGGGANVGSGGGGGGFNTDGVGGSGNTNGRGRAYINGGAGGTGIAADHGGYGGGGCGWFYGGNGGGGGGYAGGGTDGNYPSTYFGGGGGGGSYNIGTNQTNTAGFKTGNGLVVITPLAIAGAALNFDGVNDYVNLGASPALDLTGDMTVESWIYANTGANGAFIFNGGGWGIPGYTFALFGTTLRVELHNGSTGVQANNTVSINNAWNHVAFTRVASTGLIRVYVNGVLQPGTATLVGALGLNPGIATLGAYIGGSGAYFNGSMDETRIWNRALCDGEIQNNMNCEIPTNSTGLVANYHYNQGAAAGANAGVTTLNDATSNAVNGTLTNMALSGATSNWIAPGGVVTGTTCGAFVPPAVTVTPVSQTNISCFGGTNGAATVSASGTGLTYNWTPGNPTGDGTASVTGLTAGTWTCTVTNSCGGTGTQTFNITQPTALVATPASQTNISCNGGTNGAASINTPTGGAGGYTYNWTPGNPTGDGTVSVTGLTAGTWTCTVTDANSCTTTQTFNITQPTALVVNLASQTNILCNGGNNGAATVSVTGGTTSYSYNWTPGNPTGDGTASVSGLAPGTWTCTVTDANSCVSTRTVNITQPNVLVATPTSQTNISCNGGANGAATVSVTGGTTSYSYNWTPGNPTGDGTASVSGLTSGTWTCTITDANSCTTTQTFNITQPGALVATPTSQTNISCNGGTNGAATVSVTGGTTSYSYNWTPGNPTGDGTASVSGLTSGTWTCTITDANSCTTTQTFNITQPTALVATPTSQTNISCNGGNDGAATVAVTGGTTSYSYNWTPGNPTGDGTASVSGLTSGTWTCTITDANSCTITQTFNITQPGALVATPTSQTNISCNGGNDGAATVAVTGGVTSYTYAWLPSGGTAATATGLTQGSYTCTVTDANGCTTSQTFAITEPAVLVASAASQTNVSCNGGSNGDATVSVSGGTASYTYSWLPSGGTAATASGLTAGTYTCNVTDANGCTTSQSFTITEPASALAITSSATTILCNGGQATITVAATGGTAPYSGDTTYTAGAGSYTFPVTDANGCMDSTTIVITEPTAIALSATSANSSCFGSNNGSVDLTTSGGTTPYTFSWNNGLFTTEDISGLTPGTYTGVITDGNGCMDSVSVVISEPAAIVSSLSATPNVVCNNDSVTVSASISGGTGPYSYVWTPGGNTNASFTTQLANSTTFVVTVTDSMNCSVNDTIAITVDNPVVNLGNDTTICALSVVLDAGNPGSTYLWSDNSTQQTLPVSTTGVITVMITAPSGCVAYDTINIALNTPPVLTFAVTPATICLDDAAITLTASPAGGAFTGNGVSGTTFTPLTANIGSHVITYSYTDSNGCSATTSDSITVDPCIGVNAANSATNSISVYPNPNNGSFTLQLNTATQADVLIYDAQGKLISSAKVQPQTAQQVTLAETGIYLVTVITADGQRTSQRVVVNK